MIDVLPPDSCKVYTPRAIADAMVRALHPQHGENWLEPCVGRGVFLSALSDAGVIPSRITAVDLDPIECNFDVLAKTYRGVDFLAWSLSRTRRFDRIVGNPPYVPLSRLHPRVRHSALAVSVPGSESSVPSNSNIWFAFLCRCLELLRPDGSIAILLPAAWDFADYAESARAVVPRLFRDFTTFRSRRPLFDEVQDGSVIVVGRGYNRTHKYNRRVECRDKEELIANLNIFYNTTETISRTSFNEREISGLGSPLRSFIEIRLGGVTGHAEYFLLTDERRLALGLPELAVKPVLSRSRHLTRALINLESWRDLLASGERIWLFDPAAEVCDEPSVRDYLALAPESGGCDRRRYKIKKRQPWYRTPLPDPVDGFMSGMTRTGPWLALRSMRSLNATNTLYVAQFKERRSMAFKATLALAMLTTKVRKELKEKCRHYADGLMKHEPGDLMSILIPQLRDDIDALTAYSQAVKYLLSGKDREASEFADSFFRC